MTFFADILLAAGALGVGVYCFVLSRRLRRLAQLEGGVGGAIAVLSAQVDDMTRLLQAARKAAEDSAAALDAQTRRADSAARRLELMMAALHDLPEPEAPAPIPREKPQAASPEGMFRSWWERPEAAAPPARAAAPERKVRVLRRNRVQEAAL